VLNPTIIYFKEQLENKILSEKVSKKKIIGNEIKKLKLGIINLNF